MDRLTVEVHEPSADRSLAGPRRGEPGESRASKSYRHLRPGSLPLALVEVHRARSPGALVTVVVAGEGTRTADDGDGPGRRFALREPARVTAIAEGAGFDVRSCAADGHDRIVLTATRARTVPDLVRPGLRVLVCGYNPSLYAADHGVPFGRPGNRFWPAAIAAGLVTRDRDPWHAVRHHAVGFTDLVKRATTAAAELTTTELAAGLDRVTALCEWLAPEVVCVLGIGGWRSLVDRKAALGWQEARLGPSRVYVMPNPSGLNATTQHAGFVEHLTRVSGF